MSSGCYNTEEPIKLSEVPTPVNKENIHTPKPVVAAVTNDGFVYKAYPGYEDGTKALMGWRNIVSVADARGYVAGLKEDCTVDCNVYAYSGTIDTSEWEDIVAISAATSIVGLKKDGTVVSTGSNRFGI
ncbi:hypothetical protein RBH29_16500 [Herbivorax sp. ANBcel31]|uniref:hypothetical protein n=1 Tax=Herbivorax sp. ANBcel31 TaxID=3069754 RepID=UPI0027B0A04C|nr:hypothetical protein [Herbivorax sp. ANBcel31]MDQ2088030.1 hypothetical protein [Herbivorax sp. ANBcel31]